MHSPSASTQVGGGRQEGAQPQGQCVVQAQALRQSRSMQLANPPQVTSQRPGPQITWSQLSSPAQSIVQVPLQTIVGQLASPVQWMSQLDAWLQSIPAGHDPLGPQSIRQRLPSGQTTGVRQPVVLQSIVHTPSTQAPGQAPQVAEEASDPSGPAAPSPPSGVPAPATHCPFSGAGEYSL